MSHTYLIELYDLIDQRLKDTSEKQVVFSLNRAEAKFQQGRAEILMEFKQFLAEHYNIKLPRRLRNKYP